MKEASTLSYMKEGVQQIRLAVLQLREANKLHRAILKTLREKKPPNGGSAKPR